ncbi:MAG: hypothetical protein KC776_00930 [Myxococcales bacterium]|nr:hypothetical protein [Myxococcales bacterium]MCB9582713.1 hypothetical protein [Polyangiaceae bacterium]
MSERKLELKSWKDGHGVDLTLGRVVVAEPDEEYAYVKASGSYRSQRADAFNPMRMAIVGAMAWKGRARTSGLVLDLSELDYTSGDTLLLTFRTPIVRDEVGERVGLIWSVSNEPHIRSLIEDERDDSDDLLARCHPTLEACIAHLSAMAPPPWRRKR